MFNRNAGRQYRYAPVKMQVRSEDSGPVIACHFAVFNTPTELWPGCIEQIAPGAFASSMSLDVRALINHETRLVLGRTVAGTLTLREDDIGLYGEIKINEHDSDAMNLYARVQRGDVSQCSFGFDIVAEDYVVSPDGQTCTWTIREVVLYEVSVVTFPAYDATSAVARASGDMTSLKKARLERRKKELLERIKKTCLK
jgi:HK97 family phage prohead protease